MHFTLIDAGGLLLSIVAGGLVVALPGFALARLFRLARQPDGPPDALTGVVAGMALLPLIDSMVARFCGLGAALALTLALAAAACLDPAARRRPSRLAVALCGVWLCIVLTDWIDIDLFGRLFQPLTAVDMVKHAATAQAVLDSGAPPRDAFYLRPEHASYYYDFYTVAALIVRLCHGLADARAAVGGLVFWTGLAAFGLVRMALARAGLEAPGAGARLAPVIAAMLAAGGVDIVAVVVIACRTGYWHPDPVQWNEQVSGWLESLLWVPHHVTGLVAAVLGLSAVADCAPSTNGGVEPSPAGRGRASLLAALCFASALGLSVWVTLALVATAAVWMSILVVERRWRLAGPLALAGALSLLLALPQLADLRAGRAGPFELPITLTIRLFTPLEALLPDQPWNAVARLLLLPLNYLVAFGALGAGAILFWRNPRPAAFAGSEFARVLTISAVVGLVLGAFLRSTLLGNDLGWRVTLFPVLAATVWTIAVLDRRLDDARRGLGSLRAWAGRLLSAVPPPLTAALLLGYATSGYFLFSVRAYQLLPLKPAVRYMATEGETERGLRVAYAWANEHLPPDAVLQHDPARRRSFAFGLYSRNPVALSDGFGSLFGADPDAVETRMRALTPIFRTLLPNAAVRAAALGAGIDDLVVTAEDPVWAQPASFVWTASPAYASDRVRIIPVAALGDRYAGD